MFAFFIPCARKTGERAELEPTDVEFVSRDAGKAADIAAEVTEAGEAIVAERVRVSGEGRPVERESLLQWAAPKRWSPANPERLMM